MVLIVPSAGTEINVTNFGKPVTDAVNANAASLTNMGWSAWQPIAFIAPWANYGQAYPPTQIRKNVGLDMLMVRGAIMTATTSTNNVGYWPAGYRPAYNYEFITYMYLGGIQWAQIAFRTDGLMIFSYTSTVAIPYAACTFTMPLSA